MLVSKGRRGEIYRLLGITISILGGYVATSPSLQADGLQMIPASKPVMVIYSYGGSKEIPERLEPDETGGRGSQILSDVIPLGTAAPSIPLTSTLPSAFPKVKSSTPAGRDAASADDSSPSSEPTSNEIPPTPGILTLAWDPSPDNSVVGYRLYIGKRSQHYSERRDLGDETVARVIADQPLMFFVVSAYTADGLESFPSEELAVTVDLPSGRQSAAQSPQRGGSAF